MNKKQASSRWEVSEYQVRKICKHMNLDSKNIPDDTIPIYIPDRRYKRDPHRFYIFVLDVIINTHLELEGIDADTIATCVEQLNTAGLIVLKHGRLIGSIDYHDYMVSANRVEFYNWKSAKMKNKIELITPVISAVTEGAIAAGTVMQAVVMA